MPTMTEQNRTWEGLPLFSYGFRPFFFGAALWAALAMALWLLTVTGQIDLFSAFAPADWHAHEFLFGYLGTVFAGFLLTAVPNRTRRLPVVGWPVTRRRRADRPSISRRFCRSHRPRDHHRPELAQPRRSGAARDVHCRKRPFHLEAAQGAHAAGGYGLRWNWISLGFVDVLRLEWRGVQMPGTRPPYRAVFRSNRVLRRSIRGSGNRSETTASEPTS